MRPGDVEKWQLMPLNGFDLETTGVGHDASEAAAEATR